MPQTSDTGISAALGMVFLILGLSVLIPGLILNLESPQSNTFDQTEGERLVITGDLSSRATTISNQDEINVTLLDRQTAEANSTGTLSEGQSANVSIEGENVTVTNEEVYDDTTAVVTYEYPLYIGWPAGAEIPVKQAPTMILVAAVTMLVGLMFTVMKGVGFND